MSARRSTKRGPKGGRAAAPQQKPAESRTALAEQQKESAEPLEETARLPKRPARSRRAVVIAALAGAAAIAAVGAYALRDGTPTAGPRGAVAKAGLAAADAGLASAPTEATKAEAAKPAAKAGAAKAAPNAYVGSARCADCHEKEHARWKDSWHARALSPGKRPYVEQPVREEARRQGLEVLSRRAGQLASSSIDFIGRNP